MSNEVRLDYGLPILDICAVIIAIVAIFIALYTLYLSNNTKTNTENTVEELQLSRAELVKIKVLLGKLNDTASNNSK